MKLKIVFTVVILGIVVGFFYFKNNKSLTSPPDTSNNINSSKETLADNKSSYKCSELITLKDLKDIYKYTGDPVISHKINKKTCKVTWVKERYSPGTETENIESGPWDGEINITFDTSSGFDNTKICKTRELVKGYEDLKLGSSYSCASLFFGTAVIDFKKGSTAVTFLPTTLKDTIKQKIEVARLIESRL